MSSIDAILDELARRTQERFQAARAILSFSQFMELVFQKPYSLTRNSAQYLGDMMDHFGTETVRGVAGPIRRFRIFDDAQGGGEYGVIGQEEVQNEIYRCLREFVHRRRTDKMILLHGPNGSSKTTLVSALIRGLEAYSRCEEGELFRFNWIFSEGLDRGERLGFDPVREEESLESFAFLDADRVSAKIPCELSDNPIFLLPRWEREKLMEKALAGAAPSERDRFTWTRVLKEGDLSPKVRRIHDSLLTAYKGDWRKVMRHVQVERFAISRRYRSSAVTIEPQANIDAHARQIGHSTMNGLPPVLQNETLHEAFGDLVDANRGVVEYSDFCKRPMEANKYLLTAAENGTINLQSYTAGLDIVMLGTSNENYMSAFRRDPLFPSFKARLDLVRAPYLLQFSKEQQLYERELDRLPPPIRVAPHAARVAALWAVLTRLMEPMGQGLPDEVRRLIERLSPVEKAKLYDSGEAPARLAETERNLLRSSLEDLVHEYDAFEMEFEGSWDAAYEGRRGCSPREMLAFISELAIDPPGGVVTPLLVLRRLPDLIKDPGLYQFLRLKRTRNGYHDCRQFIEDVRREHLELLRQDIEAASHLVDETEYRRFFERYFRHVRAFKTREKVVDEATGRAEDADLEFMAHIESLIGAGENAETFRSGLLTKAASFRLSNPQKPLVYEEVFSDLFHRLRDNAFKQRIDKVRRVVEDAMVQLGIAPGSIDAERRREAEAFVVRMRDDRGYGDHELRESLEFFERNLKSLS